MKHRKALLSALVVGFLGQITYGGSATWNLNPGTNDWHTATNWTPATVPDGPSDIASFGISNLTGVSVTATTTTVDGIVFSAGASSYTIMVGPATGASSVFTLSGAGVTNNSGTAQNFLCTTDAAKHFGTIAFSGNASAGDLCTYTTQPGQTSFGPGGVVQFLGAASTAGRMFINNGGVIALALGGQTQFFDASAGDATFTCNAGAASSATGGTITFNGASSGESGTYTLHGGNVAFGQGGALFFNDTSTGGAGNYTIEGGGAVNFARAAIATFDDSSTAGDGTFVVLRGTTGVTFSNGAEMDFLADSSAGNATITLDGNPADLGKAGHINFNDDSTGGTARLIFTGGQVFCDTHNAPGLSVGSIEGSGNIILSGIILTIGGNNLTTEFSGLISGFGASLTKIGTGTLTLSGANTYSGGTTVNQGTFRVTNTTGSATGLGFISVLGGTLGGDGTIGGVVLVGGGAGNATLAPAAGTRGQSTLTIERFLTFRNKSSYMASFSVRNNVVTTDLVIADGVTINGATIVLHARTNHALQEGTVITLISNTATTPISGTFRNLADGAIVNVNGNNLQANYEGGDGNDLTLTVVP